MAQTFNTRFKWFIENFERGESKTFSKEEVLALLQQLYNEFKGYYKQDKVIKFILPEGFKGKGDFHIYMTFDCDVIAETAIAYRDEEGTIQEVIKRKETIPKENINKMIALIRTLPLYEPYRCYAIAKKLGWEWEDLWAERNKKTSKAYWLEYYFPIKFLQHLGLIQYTTKGTITRIK